MNEARGWLPDDLALIPAGPQLATILADVDRATLSDQDLIRLTQARQRLAAHQQAQLLADLHAIGQRSDKVLCRTEEQRHQWAEVEIAFAMTWTHHAAGWQLSLADQLVGKLPAVFDTLSRGEIDVPRAAVFALETTGLDGTVARRITDQLLPDAPRLTTGQLRVRLRRLVAAADPDRIRSNAREQVKGRRVVAQLTCDGLAEIAGHDLPPHRVAAAMQRLTAIARAAKAGGDKRKVDQLRADVLLDLLVGDGVATGGPITQATIGTDPEPDPDPDPSPAPEPAPEPVDGDDAVDPDQEKLAPLWSAGFDQLPTTRPQPAGQNVLPAPRKGVVDLQVPLTTLMGLVDFPGELAGFGPVIADIARQVAAEQADATWRFSVYDQLGQLIQHGITRRRPTAEDAAFIRARDRTCRAPGCRQPARQCDIDHSDDWVSSRDSRRCNLACLCRRHHLWKHLAHSGLIQIVPGALGFTTPLGQHLVTHPEPYVDELEYALLDTG